MHYVYAHKIILLFTILIRTLLCGTFYLRTDAVLGTVVLLWWDVFFTPSRGGAGVYYALKSFAGGGWWHLWHVRVEYSC